MSQVEYWVAFNLIPGIGPVRQKQLLDRFKDPARVFDASPGEIEELPGFSGKLARVISSGDYLSLARKEIARAEAAGFKIVTIKDPGYPKFLGKIYDPPSVLYVKGDLFPEDNRAIAVVGSRRWTEYGRRVTRMICTSLAGRGIRVVSGLARGIDSIAHRAALDAGGRTIAVLGSGLDVVYPPENRRLMEKIAAQGAVLSEFPLGTRPMPGHFPRRNRIISGLSLGVVVIEAGVRSGALITASLAIEQGREVFAVPGDATAGTSLGTNRLIQEGAKLVVNEEDILEELPQIVSLYEPREQPPVRERVELPAEEAEVFGLLGQGPVHVDTLARKAGKSTGELLATLLSLELKGVVKQLAGKMFVRQDTGYLIRLFGRKENGVCFCLRKNRKQETGGD